QGCAGVGTAGRGGRDGLAESAGRRPRPEEAVAGVPAACGGSAEEAGGAGDFGRTAADLAGRRGAGADRHAGGTRRIAAPGARGTRGTADPRGRGGAAAPGESRFPGTLTRLGFVWRIASCGLTTSIRYGLRMRTR